MNVPRANPAIKDSINALRARLRSADGSVNLVIDPRCEQLIDDLRTALWPGNLNAQHALAWLRYFVEFEYAVRPERPAAKGTIGFSP
jgi:hypothetical protein